MPVPNKSIERLVTCHVIPMQRPTSNRISYSGAHDCALHKMQGADNVIQERLSTEGKVFWKATQGHLEDFGRNGLRTLCLAYRQVAPLP